MSTNDDLPQGGSGGTIPVSDAKKGVENWDQYLAQTKQEFAVRSYTLPIISVKNLLDNNPDAEAVRIYIGLAEAGDPTSSQVYLVPIVDGHEQLFRLTPPDNPPGDPRDNSNVYDMSTACPPDCGSGGGGPFGKLGR